MFNAEVEFEKVNAKLDRLLIYLRNIETLVRENLNDGDLAGFPIGRANRWMGGEMPIPIGTPILIKYRDGDTSQCRAGDCLSVNWEHNGSDCDIFEFTILKVQS